MALTAAILIVAALATLGGVLLWPQRTHDPQRGMAVGLLMIVMLALCGLLVVLAVGYFFDVRFLVVGVFWIVMFPAILLAANLMAQPFLLWRSRRLEAQWRSMPPTDEPVPAEADGEGEVEK